MALQPYTRTFATTMSNVNKVPGYAKPAFTRASISNAAGGPSVSGGVAPEAMSAMDRAITYYQPGGGFGKGTEAALARGETKAVASGAQSLVSSGLANTTMMAGLVKKYQEEVGIPTRARVEETRAGAISGLEMMKAQIIQGATESARSSALQKYLAQLQSDTAITAGAMRGIGGPTITARTPAAPARTTQPAYKDVPYDSIIAGSSSGITGRSPTAAYGGRAGDTKFAPLWSGGEYAAPTLEKAQGRFRLANPNMF